MPKLEQPTKEMILEAASKSSIIKTALKDLWPGAFGPEPVKMEGKIEDSNGLVVVWVNGAKNRIVLSKHFKWKLHEQDGYFYAAVTPTRK